MAPAMLTAAVPEIPALTPTAARSSLFVAVTATPRKPESDPLFTCRGPEAPASPAGRFPCLTRLCDLPIPMTGPLRFTIVEPASVDFLSRSLRELPLTFDA